MRALIVAFSTLWCAVAFAAGPSPYIPKRADDVHESVTGAPAMPCTATTAFGVRLAAPLSQSPGVRVLKRKRSYAEGPYTADFDPQLPLLPFTEFEVVETLKSELVWQVNGVAHFRTDELAYEQALLVKTLIESETGSQWSQRKWHPTPRVGSMSLLMSLPDLSIELALDRNRLLIICASQHAAAKAMQETGLAR